MSEPQKAVARSVPGVVWIPSYIAICGVAQALFGSLIVTLVLLFVSGAILEVLYRLAFGEKRHELRVQAIAFGAQCLMWGGIIAAYKFAL